MEQIMSNLTIKPRQPNAKGMIILDIKWWPLDKVIPSSQNSIKNIGRTRGVNNNQVEKLMNLIETNNYEPEYHIPPVGEEAGGYLYLSTGENRWWAHKNVGASEYYAASVRWVKEDGKSGEYWKRIWTSNENDPSRGELTQCPRKPEDITSVTLSLISCGEIQPTDEQIGRVLIDQGLVKNSATWKNQINDVKSKLGLGGVVDTVGKSLASEIEKKYSKEDTDCVARVHNKETAMHRDYTPRLINEVLVPNLKGHLSGQTVKKQLVKYYFNGMTPTQIKKTRPLLQNKDFIEDYYNKICKPFCDLYESGVFDEKFEVSFINQLEQDNWK